VLSLVTYRVELPGYIRAHNVFHICNHKAYIARPDKLPRPGPVENTDVADNYHAVDKIIKHRMRGNKYQYVVKYTDYANAESKWMNKDNIIGNGMQNYWNRQETSSNGGVLTTTAEQMSTSSTVLTSRSTNQCLQELLAEL
ncbi:hypothetical protein GGI14_006526, partial [Coemansia sp. S680]